jgi:hypothetical protein
VTVQPTAAAAATNLRHSSTHLRHVAAHGRQVLQSLAAAHCSHISAHRSQISMQSSQILAANADPRDNSTTHMRQIIAQSKHMRPQSAISAEPAQHW